MSDEPRWSNRCMADGCPLRDETCAGLCGDLTPGGYTTMCSHPAKMTAGEPAGGESREGGQRAD